MDIDTRIEYFSIRNGLQAPRMSESDRKRRKKALSLSLDQVLAMIRVPNDRTVVCTHLRLTQLLFEDQKDHANEVC